MSKPTENTFRLTNPSATELLWEYDNIIISKIKEGYEEEEAKKFASQYQKDKYYKI